MRIELISTLTVFSLAAAIYFFNRRRETQRWNRVARAVDLVSELRSNVETPRWTGSEYVNTRNELVCALFWVGAIDAASQRYGLTDGEFYDAFFLFARRAAIAGDGHRAFVFHQTKAFSHPGYRIILAGSKAYLRWIYGTNNVAEESRDLLRTLSNDSTLPVSMDGLLADVGLEPSALYAAGHEVLPGWPSTQFGGRPRRHRNTTIESVDYAGNDWSETGLAFGRKRAYENLTDRVGVEIHQQLMRVMFASSTPTFTPSQLVFTAGYLQSFVFVALSCIGCRNEHIHQKYIHRLCEGGALPLRLWDAYERGRAMYRLARDGDRQEFMDVRQLWEQGRGAGIYDVHELLYRDVPPVNLENYLRGRPVVGPAP